MICFCEGLEPRGEDDEGGCGPGACVGRSLGGLGMEIEMMVVMYLQTHCLDNIFCDCGGAWRRAVMMM